MNLIKRYRPFIGLLVIYVIGFIVIPTVIESATVNAGNSLVEMLSVVPPVFVLLGLLDVWVKRETMVKAMGKGSGITGVLLGFFLGSAAAGPLYAAFPVAITLLRKGSSLRNVLIMMGAWSTTKIPLLMFEASSMGWLFTVTRFGLNIIGIMGIALITERLLHPHEVETIRRKLLETENA